MFKKTATSSINAATSEDGQRLLFDLDSTNDSGRFRLDVTDGISVGPPGNVFLFGGAGLAAAVLAMKRIVGRELVWATAQYLSYARLGAIVDIAVTVAAHGRNVSQATAVARVGDEVIFTVAAAFGERSGQPVHQWIEMPEMPAPADCIAWPLWPKQGGGLNARLDLRLEPGGAGTQSPDGRVDPAGSLRLWARTTDDHPVDAVLLAMFGDLMPAGAAAALGGTGGGNSLDNTVRLRAIVPTGWVLCDIRMAAAERGFGHGEVRLFAEDGTLMAIASQSLILRFL